VEKKINKKSPTVKKLIPILGNNLVLKYLYSYIVNFIVKILKSQNYLVAFYYSSDLANEYRFQPLGAYFETI
jgi:hypothetical protein